MVNTGVNLISKERERQVDEEGWTPEYDEKRVESELAVAASCYEIFSSKDDINGMVRELAKAGALIAAEIDRLLRLKGGE